MLGKRLSANGDEWCLASEDCAFGPNGFERVRDVQPGEMVVVTPEGRLLSKQCVPCKQIAPCIFEYIYLSRPDSVLNDISVYNFQLGLGRRLAKRIRYKPDHHCHCIEQNLSRTPGPGPSSSGKSDPEILQES